MGSRVSSAIRRVLTTGCAVFLSVLLVGMAVPASAFSPASGDAAYAQDAPGASRDAAGGEGAGEGEGDNQPPAPEAVFVSELFLKWSADYGGANVFVGPNGDMPNVEITRKGQLVQLNGYYTDTSGDGVMYETASTDSPLGRVDLIWTSSDDSIATVDPNGLVTPRGNGTATITATTANPADQGSAALCVPFVIDGQEGEYVGSVEITDADGNPIYDTIVIDSPSDTTQYYQLYATITWVDAEGSVIREERASAESSATYRWVAAGNTNVVSVNERTGRVATLEPGVGAAEIRVEGGVGGQTITDTVYVQVVTGQQSDGMPAQSLTINVFYQSFPDEPAVSEEFSLDELASRFSQVTHFYTMLNGSTFGTMKATGYLFKDVLSLVNVPLESIISFSFGTGDNYVNNISYAALFNTTRYYFPDIDIGRTAGGQVVPPILATAAYINMGAATVLPSQQLDENVRFRLCFGATGIGDANTSMQVHSIHTVNITIPDPPEQPLAPGPGDAEGSGAGGSSDGSDVGLDGDGASELGQGAEAGSVINRDSTGGAGSAAGDEGSSATARKEWRIYQIISKEDPLDIDFVQENPLSPYAVPAACLAMIGGGISSALGFRRRLYS